MAQNLKTVNQAEIARWVTRQMIKKAEEKKEAISITPQQVLSIFKCIGNFIGFMFRKADYNWAVAEIFCLGTAIRNHGNGAGQSDFIPSNSLQSETKTNKQMPAKMQEPIQKQELTLAKLALVSQLSEQTANQVMIQICKAIGHYLRNEGKTVILDLGLPNNEVLVFEDSTVYFVSKEKIKDLLTQGPKSTQSNIDTQSIFGRSARSRARLGANRIQILETNTNTLDTYKNRYQDDETKSFRSAARSLSIQVKPVQQKQMVTARAVKALKEEVLNQGTVSATKKSFFTKENDALTQFLGKTLSQTPHHTSSSQESIQLLNTGRKNLMNTIESKPLIVEDQKSVARLVTSTQDPITVHDDFEVKNNTFEKRPSYTLGSKIKTPLSTAGMLLANSAVKLSSRDPSPQVFEKSLPDLIVRADRGLSLKERLNRTKQERLNEDFLKLRQTLGTNFLFGIPGQNNPEIEQLLQSTPAQTCLKAGASNLGQQAFKVMRPSNLARLNLEKSEELTKEQLEKLFLVQLGLKKNLKKSVEDYKQSVIDAYVEKKASQKEFGSYWKMQMGMNETIRSQAAIDAQQDPDTMWTVEGPTRKVQDAARRNKAVADMKVTLDTQAQFFKSNLENQRFNDLKEGKKLCDADLQEKSKEDQIINFKKQIFASQMTKAWDHQLSYKKTLQQVEEIF